MKELQKKVTQMNDSRKAKKALVTKDFTERLVDIVKYIEDKFEIKVGANLTFSDSLANAILLNIKDNAGIDDFAPWYFQQCYSSGIPQQSGAELILEKRLHQIAEHGFSADFDLANNSRSELLQAAIYLLSQDEYQFPKDWDKEKLEHLQNKTYVEQLVIAGTFIAAEIDRLRLENPDVLQTPPKK